MARAKGSLSKTLVWILLGLLIVGLAGFGATNLSGSLRSVGEVGDKAIEIDRYARALQNELNARAAEEGRALPFAEAQAEGVPNRVLSQLVVARAFDHEADRIGVSVGDATLAQKIRGIQAFQGPDGSFDRDAYAFALRNAGLSEAEFEADLRADTARSLLQGAVIAGTTMPGHYVDTLLAHSGERRAFTWARLDENALDTPLPEPSDADLRAWYEANLDRFTRPRARMITYLWATPDMILDSVEVDEAALREAYEARMSEFDMPERRLVERLVYADEDAARAARARLESGEVGFEDLVAERGLALADVDLGDVARDDLGAAAEAVFATDPGAVAGPVPIDLGAALFRVNGVLAAQNTPFEEARPMLRDELARDRARRVLETLAEDSDNELAAGATLEELAGATQLETGEILYYAGIDDGIAGYAAFRAAAEALDEGDFPEMAELGDGGVFALRLDEIRPPEPLPFEDVRAAVRDGLQAERVTAALSDQAEALRSRIAEGETFTEAGLDPREEFGLTRSGAVEGVPAGLVEAVFDMAPGTVRALPGPGVVVLVRLDEIVPVDLEAEQTRAFATLLSEQAAGDVAQDLFGALSADIQRRAGVTINQQALNAVHAQLQ